MPGKKQKEHTYTLDGFITGEAAGGLISGIISSLANGWAYIQEGLKPWGGGGGFKHGIVRYTIKCLGSL